MYHVTTKLEVNVFGNSVSDVDGLTAFVVKHRIPCIVVDPAFLSALIIERSHFNYAHKIICAIDFGGKDFSFNKMRDLSRDVWSADGYDILVSPNRTDIETFNEMKSLREFINKYDQTKEVRWALNLRNKGLDFSHALKHAKNIPGSFIRTDINLVSPASNLEAHKADIALISSHVATPIKVSGSVSYNVIKELSSVAARFDVSLAQARGIVACTNDANKEYERAKSEAIKSKVAAKNVSKVSKKARS